MEFSDAVRRRRMVRSYSDRPLEPGLLDELLGLAARAPSAGFTQGWAFVALEGREETERFWSATFDPEARASFRHQGLFRAPAVVVPLSSKQAYLERYSQPDKASDLAREESWPVPYWDVDCAFATMTLLLGAVDAGLGALFFGIFSGEAELLAALGVPAAYRPIGAVTLGYPDGGDQPRRGGRRPLEQVVHRGRW